ncbi:hypothetical protein [Undibacterium sp. Tian12W]|uniref:hypothetical protein n=1 Tax=Undibacterium sp. Tian12W TaxID=3413054 RepID=UPI003BEFF743
MFEEKLNQYAGLINALLAESIKCSPASWSEGFLHMDSDGLNINYKLKNAKSNDKAQISGPLRDLCEEVYVVMRQNGDIWRDATLHFFKADQGWNYKINFNYSNKAIKKPWWKFFASSFDESLFEGVWYSLSHDKKGRRKMMSRSSFALDGTATIHFKIKSSDGAIYEEQESGSWNLHDGVLVRQMIDNKYGSERKIQNPMMSLSRSKMKYKDSINGVVYNLEKESSKLIAKWEAFLP